jgi:hypothetical protein
MRSCHPALVTAIGLVALLLASMRVVGGGAMFWYVSAHLVALLLDLITARRGAA